MEKTTQSFIEISKKSLWASNRILALSGFLAGITSGLSIAGLMNPQIIVPSGTSSPMYFGFHLVTLIFITLFFVTLRNNWKECQ